MNPRLSLAITVGIFFCFALPQTSFGQTQLPSSKTVQTKSGQSLTPSAAAKTKKHNWPKQKVLLGELESLAANPATRTWSQEMAQLLELLQSTDSVSDPNAQFTLQQLAQKLTLLPNVIGQAYQANLSSDQISETVSELQRIGYKFERRIAVWTLLNQHALQQPKVTSKNNTQQVSLSWIDFDSIDPQWAEYLTFDEAQSAFQSLTPDREAQRDAARKILGRIYSPALDESQKHHIFQRILDPAVLSALKQTAAEDVNHFRLMALMELYESTDSGLAAYHLNDQYQNLLWSEDPIARQTANQIDTYYRNANVRIAVNQRLINRLVPQMPATTEPFSDNVMGAKVSGQNHIQNQLHISFIENPSKIDLRFETVGQVDSRTSAKKSGFTIQNHAKADFQVFKRLAFSRTGVTSDLPSAFSNAKQRLVGLRGKHDRVPVIGWLARRIAKQKVEEQTPASERMVEDKIETQAKDRMQELVEQQVNQMRFALDEQVVQPLISIGLEPEPVQLSTTNDRIVTRYRLAGRDQLGAHTSRPTDFDSDLLSIQLHQSAVNNLVQRFELNGKKFTSEALAEHLQKVVGVTIPPSDSPTEANFQFAEHDAMRIDFRDGEITVEMKLASMQIGSGKTWRRFKIGTTYVPQYSGTQLVLTQKDGIELTGKKLRLGDEMAIRTACKVIFDQHYTVNLIPDQIAQKIPASLLQSLIIDRLSIADGWFGVVFNEATLTQSVPMGQLYENTPYQQPVAYPSQQPQTIIYDQAFQSDGTYRSR